MRDIPGSANCRGILHPAFEGVYQSGMSYSLINGIADGVNPGTREKILFAHQHIIKVPTVVYGVHMALGGALTVNTDIRIRHAIFSSDGDFWRGVTGTQTGLPKSLLVGDTASALLSAYKTGALGAVSGRFLGRSFPGPTLIAPQKMWVLTLMECQYAADTINTSVFSGPSDSNAFYPHQLGSTGASRNIAWGTIITTAIDSVAWSTYENAAAASWSLATSSAGAFTLAAARTHSGGAGNWNWGLVCGYPS